jgi:light-regulated signal transduction histidine kinase (bacteriophytochrome)/CheY-like chemotaxis protein
MDYNLLEPIECDHQPIHLSGYIQPYGILIALQEPDLQIIQISANVDHYFGTSSQTLLGKPLETIISKKQINKIIDCLKLKNIQENNPFDLKISISTSASSFTPKFHLFSGVLHRNKSNILILELEPHTYTHNHNYKSQEFYHLLQGFMSQMRQVTDLSEFAQLLATKVRLLNNFDRVMVYQFDPTNQSGEVIAEDKQPELDSYLGLHYPASDIPKKARDIFAENWVRFIPNVGYQPVPIIGIDSEPLDLTHASLRSVAIGHIQYLQNMGVSGSMSISIRNENVLWGMVACHHNKPKYLSYETRQACEFFGQIASIELLRQQEIETRRYQILVKSIYQELRQAFCDQLDFVQQVIDRNQSKLLDLVAAQGAAILLDDRLTLIGNTPSSEKIQALIAWFLEQNLKSKPMFFTNALSQIYPQGSEIADVASGVAIATIFVKQKSHHILWFRPEQIQIVNWAGASSNPITIADNGERQYTPRASFQLWTETVRNKSLVWQPLEMESASEMRKILMQAILDSAQVTLERSAELEQSAKESAIANRAKSEFLAKMSHELRTPLTAILGFTHLIARDRSLITAHKDHLNIISRSSEHLLSLINDVLEISKIESGQIDLNQSAFDLYRLIYSIKDMFAIKAVNKVIELRLHIASGVPQYVYGDAGKLRQILLNIVGNAIKFTASGSVSMRISAEPVVTDFDSNFINTQIYKFIFQIEDSGTGLSEQDMRIIFDTFKQTDQGKSFQGSGLGLSISRQFAKLMSGDVTVTSILGEGSIFSCVVQMIEVEANVVATLKEPDLVISLKAGQPNYRILVVDDVLEIRQLLTNLLESVGLQVYTAENGQTAIAMYQEVLPHLILMDISMPIMDGYEATKTIRAISRGSNTKIVALTASAFDSDRAAAIASGCDDFVAKPFSETTIFMKIASLLGAEYVYAETTTLDAETLQQQSSLKPLTQEDLQVLGPQLINLIHQAALMLDETTLNELIEQIPNNYKSIAQTLEIMVANLQFEFILELTHS